MATINRGGINNNVLIEKVEVLNGDRGDKNKRAVRLKEFEDFKSSIGQSSSGVSSSDILAIKQQLATVGGQITTIQQALTADDIDISTLLANVASINTSIGELQAGFATLTAVSDLNTAVKNKAFTWSNTSANTPVAGSYGRGLTIAASANDLTQIGIINATGQMFVRYRTGGTWGAWADIVSLRAEPYALQSNPGATPFPAAAYTAIPFYTNGEISAGITLSSNTIFTMAAAGLYQFELEVRINGGATSMPPVGTVIGLSIDTTTTPTALRAGYSAAGVVAATTILRLVCTERLAAGAQRTARILNQGAATYQVTSAVIKITRLSA